MLRALSRPRHFSSSRLRRADVPPTQPQLDALLKSEFFKKMSKSPEAIAALTRMNQVIQATGVDIGGSQRPSFMAMAKLAMNPEAREAAATLKAALEKAGIDIESKELVQEMLELYKAAGGVPPK